MKTIPLKLKTRTVEEKQQLMELLCLKRECFNYLSGELYKLEWKKLLSLPRLHNLFYYKLKDKFPDLQSQVLIKVEQEVISTYKTIKSNKHKIDKAPCQKNLVLQLDKRLYSSMTDTSIKLPSIKDRKRIECEYVLYPRLKEFLENNTPHDPKFYVKNDELWLSIPFDVPETVLKDESCLGVDLGIRCVASCSDGRIYQCKDFKKQKRKLKYLKRCLQKSGSKSAKRHLKKLKHKIRNFSKDYIHKLTNGILKTDKSIVVLEDLKGIKKNTATTKEGFKRKTHNRVFGDIPIYQIRQFLTYKASHLGKMVVTVSPKFTSQRDCRGLDKGKRVGRRYYAVDGIQLDSDLNAAINICNAYSETNHPISLSVLKHPTYIGRLTNQPANRDNVAVSSKVTNPIALAVG